MSAAKSRPMRRKTRLPWKIIDEWKSSLESGCVCRGQNRYGEPHTRERQIRDAVNENVSDGRDARACESSAAKLVSKPAVLRIRSDLDYCAQRESEPRLLCAGRGHSVWLVPDRRPAPVNRPHLHVKEAVGDLTVKARVDGAVNFTHAADSKGRPDLVRAEVSTRREGHCVSVDYTGGRLRG
jgi:hypothetical protein